MRINETERTWNWLDDGLLPYLLAAMRAVWIWLLLHTWSNWMQPPRADVIVPLGVFALLALSTLLAQIAVFKLREVRGRELVTGGGIIAVALTVYVAFGSAWFQDVGAFLVTVFAAAWCWRWGILAGREALTYDTFARNFMYGVVALTVTGFIAFTTHVLAPGELILPILFFFGLGLGALALASLRDAQQYERAKSGVSFALDRYWMVTVGIVIVGMLAVGLMLGSTFAPEWTQRVIAVLLAVWQFVTGVLLALAFAIAVIFFGALGLLGRIIHFTQGETEPPQIQVPRLDELFQNQENPTPQVPPELYLLVQIVAVLSIALVLAALFALALRRFRNYAEEDVSETRDSVFSIDLLQAQLRKLFRRDAEKPIATAPFAEIRGEDARAQIRKIYQELLAWADTRGLKRRPGQTPRELEHALAAQFATRATQLALITNEYLNARYSAEPISAQTAAQVLRAWQELVQLHSKEASG